MTLRSPSAACVELVFRGRHAVGAGGLLALEDYARAVTRAEGAEAVPDPADPSLVAGVHLCAPEVPPVGPAAEDVEAFARDMAEPAAEKLGWS